MTAIVAALTLTALQACTTSSPEGGGGTLPEIPSPGGTPTTTGTSTPAPPTTGFRDRVPVLPGEPFDYSNDLPDHFDDAIALQDPSGDPGISDAGATLGRVLFYDVNLSANRTIRCASCHDQSRSFTDPFLLSQGVGGGRTRRHSMTLANVRFNGSGRYFWDERAPSLEAQMREALTSPNEMAMSAELLRARIAERDFYRPLFEAAFGDEAITDDRIDSALAQFVRSLVSANAPYDTGRAQVSSPLDPFPNFTAEENRGKALFNTSIAAGGGGCSSCHVTEAHLTDPAGISNNGVTSDDITILGQIDRGGFETTGDPGQLGAFRVPSLRNVAVSEPYMHDGRFGSLAEVVDHYNRGIQPHPNLSPLLQNDDGSPVRLELDANDAAALVAFLGTLTDEEFLRDQRFSDPFRFQAGS